MRGTTHQPSSAFRHEALLYAGEDEFVGGTVAFIRAGLEAGEPILVVVRARKIDLLRQSLGADATAVEFADMAEVGTNPARIIPAWRDFVATHAGRGRPPRGIAEPIWAERNPDELVECQGHESLLNLAFEGAPAWRLLCPYDTATLPPAVIEEGRRSHPFIVQRGAESRSRVYRGLDAIDDAFTAPLDEPVGKPPELRFRKGLLDAVRRLVARQSAGARLPVGRTEELLIAVDEVATNSLVHGGGEGRLRVWQESDALVCEIRDRGRIGDPMVGRVRPATEEERGRGLWLANQLCDLVQIRSFPTGVVVRLHMRVPPAAPEPGGFRILMIEDDADFVDLYRIGLSRAGHVVRWAPDGDQGLVLARGWRPDLILLAMRLRGRSGVDLLRRLREDPGTRTLPVVVLSNYDEREMGFEPGASGALEWMIKTDVTPGHVSEWIERHLARHGEAVG
jgi:CheY-like chemotaxis protein